MMNDNNIPDAEQSWVAAEKLLDKHFKRRKLIIWFFSIMIPALIIGLSLFFNMHKKSQDNNALSMKKSASSISPVSVEQFSEKNVTDAPVAPNVTPNDVHSPVLQSTDSEGENNSLKRDRKPAYTNQSAKTKNNISFISSPNIVGEKKSTKQNAGFNDKTNYLRSDNLNANKNSTAFYDEISFIQPFNRNIQTPQTENRLAEKPWSVKSNKKDKYVGFEVVFYGGVHYNQKKLTSENDWDNYLVHRQNEEDEIFTPSMGVAFSAIVNSLGFSIGLEYSTYGEKTNYYPYSNQDTYIPNTIWRTDTVYYVDTDTAYITGNQFFIQSTLMRQDSVYVQSQDTIVEYKYDEEIAKSNGVNRFYYLELPIEISYSISRGRTGFGLSGGVSPGMLVNEKGNYLRSDGKGIESFSEIQSFRKFMINGRVSVDFYYRFGDRTKLVLRPQLKANLNSVFDDDYGVNQKYYSTGILFGISYMLN